MKSQSPTKQRRAGRPSKGEGPAFPADEVDRALVHGEADDQGRLTYPSYRELAQRFGVSHSVIADFARRHNCVGRRDAATKDIRRRADEMLVELRAKKLALEEDDISTMVDLALLNVIEMLKQGRMRCDSATDINLLVRLREFLRGNADSRQEMLGGLTLEDLEKRHLSALQRIRNASPAVCGRPLAVLDSQPKSVAAQGGSDQ